MARKALRSSQLISYHNIAAGHEGVLTDKSGDLFIKPCTPAEIEFYQVTCVEDPHPDFVRFMPRYMGTLKLGAVPNLPLGTITVTSSETIPVPIEAQALNKGIDGERTWVPTGGGKIETDSAIVLGNVTAGFKKPNILDVKLGARLWADDAPLAKRAELEKRAAATTSKELGFRIAGMKTWHGHVVADSQDESHLDGYKIYKKSYGRSLTTDTVYKAFEEFFLVENAGITRRLAKLLLRGFIEDLHELQDMLEKEECRLISSSLLFVYEGDGDALQESLEKERKLRQLQDTLEAPGGGDFANTGDDEQEGDQDEDKDEDEDEDKEELQEPKIQAVKLIDFAHASWTRGHGPDENLLHGIKSVINILNRLKSSL